MKQYFRLFRLLSVTVLLVLAISTLLAASKADQFNVSFPLTDKNPIVAGLMLSALNPLHVPFWMGWTVVLKNRGLLSDNKRLYNIFVISIGTGTLMGFAFYGMAGHFLIGLLGHWQGLLNWVLGAILLVTAFAQLYRTFPRPLKTKQRSTAQKQRS